MGTREGRKGTPVTCPYHHPVYEEGTIREEYCLGYGPDKLRITTIEERTTLCRGEAYAACPVFTHRQHEEAVARGG